MRRHLTFVLRDDDVPEIAALRRRWDPVMASGVPPHVTLVYPEEHTDEAALLERARRVASEVDRFPVALGRARALDDGCGALVVDVADATGTWDQLRERLLPTVSDRMAVRPHLTIVHPRTSSLGPAAAAEIGDRRFEGEAELGAFWLTATDTTMQLVERFDLRDGGRRGSTGRGSSRTR